MVVVLMAEYSDRQLDVILNIGKTPMECHVGPYGCGKTYSIEIALGLLCYRLMSEGATGLNIVLLGKTQQAVKKNQCNVLADAFGEDFKFDKSVRDGKTKDAVLFKQYIHIIGFNDRSSESKFRGLSNIFCIVHDEAIFCTEEQFSAILSRLRGTFSPEYYDIFKKLGVSPFFYICSTNPDSPMHWLKKRIDGGNTFNKVVNWSYKDATYDTAKQYYDKLFKLYPVGSLDYNRYLMGQWCAAEGTIFKNFLEHKDEYIVDKVDKNKIGFVHAGLDIGGNKSGSSLVFTAFYKNVADGMIVLQSDKILANKGEIDPETLNNWVIDQFNKFYGTYRIAVAELSVDNAEQYIEAGVRNALNKNSRYCIPVGDALKIKIMERVKFIQRMFSLNMLHIYKDCTTVINSLGTLVYDDKKTVDTVLDNGTTDNDTFDAFCYSFEKQIRRFDYV